MEYTYPLHTFPYISHIKQIASLFKQNGFKFYVVGGAVRDFLLQRQVKDIDFSTDASPDIVMKMFPRSIPTGIAHGTVTILFYHLHFEVTSFRIDGDYSNYRSPDSIAYTTSLEKDLERRDFTINAIALDPLQEHIIDMHNGIEDLQNNIIRCVGNASKRFQEDALRMLRAIRFSCNLNFSIENESRNAIKTHASLISHISKERIWTELSNMFSSLNVYTAVQLLHENNLFHIIFSFALRKQEMDYCKKIYTFSNMLPSVYNKNTIQTLSLHIAICFIAHGITTYKEYTAILKTLKLSNAQLHLIQCIIKNSHYTIIKKRNNKQMRVWSTFKQNCFIYTLGIERALFVLYYYYLNALAQNMLQEAQGIQQYMQTIQDTQDKKLTTLAQLAINGNDIMKLNTTIKGRNIGLLLHTALRYVLQYPEKNTKTILLEYIKKRVPKHN